MHEIEPFYGWRDYYIASEDKQSPFYRREYSEFEYTHQIYNYYIHPQWDDIESQTLFCKILFADYDEGFAVIEFIGEWNDTIENDILTFRNEVAERLQENGINKFILIGENILNYHSSDDAYYEEWQQNLEDEGGWIVLINYRPHVLDEMRRHKLHYYMHMGEPYNNILWRKFKPGDLFELVEGLLLKFLK